jgi:hypothetical protein
MDPEAAVSDFHARRENYMRVYEPVSERDGPFVKIINSKQFIVNSIRGYLPLKVSLVVSSVQSWLNEEEKGSLSNVPACIDRTVCLTRAPTIYIYTLL